VEGRGFSPSIRRQRAALSTAQLHPQHVFIGARVADELAADIKQRCKNFSCGTDELKIPMNSDARMKLGKILLLVGRIALGAIFLIAAYGKLKPQYAMPWSAHSIKMSVSLFAMQVDSYQMLPPHAVNFVAHVLPFFEVFLGLWLISGIALRVSSIVATLAFCGFMVAIFSAYHRGLGINCGCGIGPVEQVGPGALIRDGLKFLPLSLAVVIGSFWLHRKSRPAPSPETAASIQA